MKKQKEQDEALNSKTVKKSEKEKAKLREESRLEIEKQQKLIDQTQAEHKAALEEQERLKIEIEKETAAKAQAQEIASELTALCSNLRHKALAGAMSMAKQARLTREA